MEKRKYPKGRENKRVCVVGCGALGSVALNLLARSRIKKLIIIDRDIVEGKNLGRQILYTKNDIDRPKVSAALEKINKINNGIKIETHFSDLTHENVHLLKSDIIFDCTDNLETRFLINEFCIKNEIPWVYATAVRSSGYVHAFVPEKSGPCLRCFIDEKAKAETCETAGVDLQTAFSIASAQFAEAMKVLSGKEAESKLVYLNAGKKSTEKFSLKKNPRCPACKGEWEYLSGEKSGKVIRFCSSGNYQVTGKPVNIARLEKELRKKVEVVNFGYGLRFGDIIIFKDGRALIKAGSEMEAKSLYSKWIGN